MNELSNHYTREYSGIVLDRLRHLPPGGKMGDLPIHLQHDSFIRKGDKKTGGPNLRLLRLENGKPSLTVTAYIFNKFVHPSQDRHITPREAACLQDFPDDWAFSGTLGQVQKQVGNAVPIRLATAVAKEVARFLSKTGVKKSVTLASYFSGGGGLDLGFENASHGRVKFKTKFATDIEAWAVATLNANRPSWNAIQADIRRLNPKDVVDMIGGEPDVIIGGPPCQSFSVAGKQKGTESPLGRLYVDYLRHVEKLQPKIVIMENVYGLAQVKASKTLAEIYKSFKAIGYQVRHQELNAADYGTPQKRRRLIFVAAKDLSKFEYPNPTHMAEKNLLSLPVYNGAGEAIEHLPPPAIVRSRAVAHSN
ncbi:DNA (cytosine-5-)-methyltransferase [Planctomycetota bacterium]|nr:DNA (cytosine-5-)-methyltransferase [Planctomycetota bacterium]